METEIKLLLDPQSREAVESHPLVAESPARDSAETTTYFDTPDFALRHLGAILRIRAADRGYVQTIKTKAPPGHSLLARQEWEWPVAALAIDPAPVAAEPMLAETLGGLLERVIPMFATDIRRTTRRLFLEGKTTVELVLDQGAVRVGNRAREICEVELELKGGPLAPLFGLAADLAGRAKLRFGAEAKSDRGYGLIPEAPPAPAPDAARSLVLPKSTTLGEGFPLLVQAALADFAGDLAGAGRGVVEAIHRLRATVRKLRTLLALFGPCLAAEAALRFDAQLRDFGLLLGQGRDWDVFLTETLVEAAAVIGSDDVEPLRKAALERDEASHRSIAEAIAGPVPTDILLGLGAFVAEPHWLVGEPTRPLCEVVPDLLDRLAETVQKRHKKARTGSAEDLHRLRKAMKKLRYATEDVGSLFEAKAARRHGRRVKAVLATLGTINDTAVTAHRIADLAPDPGSAMGSAATDLLAWNAKRRKKTLRAFTSAWRKFEAAEPFWA